MDVCSGDRKERPFAMLNRFISLRKLQDCRCKGFKTRMVVTPGIGERCWDRASVMPMSEALNS